MSPRARPLATATSREPLVDISRDFQDRQSSTPTPGRHPILPNSGYSRTHTHALFGTFHQGMVAMIMPMRPHPFVTRASQLNVGVGHVLLTEALSGRMSALDVLMMHVIGMLRAYQSGLMGCLTPV